MDDQLTTQAHPSNSRARWMVVIGSGVATLAVVTGGWVAARHLAADDPETVQVAGPGPAGAGPTAPSQIPAPVPSPAPATSEPAAPETTPAVPVPSHPAPGSSLGRPGERFASFRADGTFTPRDGVRVVAQRSGVDLGASFAGPGENTGVARLERGGRTWWAVARGTGDGAQVIVVSQGVVQAADLAAFVTWARGVYGADSGEGLL